MADIKENLKALQERFIALPLYQKLLVVGLPAAVLTLTLLVFFYSFKPEYTVLYGNLSPEDMNAILTELDKEGIKYEIAPDGRTILVPEDKVRDVRLKLAAKGVPNKGVIGYELFDKSSIGISEFQQRVNFKRAIEGELVRTILRFENIEDARVHIALPEKSIFLRDEKEPSASVFIKLKPGTQITPEQVKAIRNLVAASVENLRPQRVVIIDDRGRNLTAMLEDEESRISTKQLKIKKEFEKEIERKVQSALEEALGYGNVKVRVSVELDFSKVQRREEIYDPDMTAVVSEHKKKEKTVGTAIEGVPGTESNIPPATGAIPGTQNIITERKETTTNYEVSKKEVVSVDPTLKIKRMSVGVLINKEVQDIDIESIKQIVSASAGIDPKRGDTLSVVAVPFKKPVAFKEEEPVPLWKKLLIPGIAGLVIALLALFGILKFLRKREPVPVPAEAPVAEEVATIAGAEALRETARELEIVKTVTEVAKKEPKKVAALLKLWLREE